MKKFALWIDKESHSCYCIVSRTGQDFPSLTQTPPSCGKEEALGQLNIPKNAVSAVLLIRHSISVQAGDDRTRTLTPDGVELCRMVSEHYHNLVKELALRFGEPEYWASEFPRAILTLWELFGPQQINQSTRLNMIASMTKVNGGLWYAHGKRMGKTDIELIRELIADPLLQQGEPFADGIVRYLAFLMERESKLTIAVGHEAHISFAAAGLLPAEQLGFDTCEGVVIYRDAGKIIGAQKFVPI